MLHLVESNGTGEQRFHFDALVRGLCASANMKEYVQGITAAARNKQRGAAAAIATALQVIDNEPLDDTPITNRWDLLVCIYHSACHDMMPGMMLIFGC